MTWSHPFRDVLQKELDGFGEDPAQPGRLDPVIQRAHDARMAGIAFSGGGIRSATFNLGVLQALADLKLLRKFHYLSTVSGGGYIGSWLVAWIYRRGGDLREVTSVLRTAWAEHLSGGAPEEIRFLRRFSNYLTPKLGWLGADTWTVIAIYLRNVLLNMTTLIAALAVVLMLPRVLGVLMGSPLQATGGTFPISALFFLGLLALAAAFVGWNVLFLQGRERDIWAGEVLEPGKNNASELLASAAADGTPTAGEIPLKNPRESFRDFVLDLTFTRNVATAQLIVAVRIASQDDVTVTGWEVNLGEDVGAQAGDEITARPVRLEPPESEERERLRLVCVDQTCTAQLNGQVVDVSRPRGSVPKEGRITLRQAATGGVVVHSALIRPLADPPLASRQGMVQALIVLPLLLAGLISVHWLGQKEALSQLLRVPANWGVWFDNLQWVLWAGIAAATLIVAHIFELCAAGLRWGLGQQSSAPPSPLSPLRQFLQRTGRILWSIFAIAVGGAVGGLFLKAFHQHFLPTVPESAASATLPEAGNFWPRLVLGPPAFIVAVSIMLILYIGLRGRHLSEAMREWWSRLGAWLLIYALLWVGLFGIALYGPPVLHWLAVFGQTAFAGLSLGWIATTLFGLLASKSPKTGQHTASPWRERLTAIAPYVFIAGLLAGLAWAINWIVSPIAPVALHTSFAQCLILHWQAMGAAHPGVPLTDIGRDIAFCLTNMRDGLPLSGNCLLFLLLLSATLVAAVLGYCVDINEFSMHMMYRNRLARCYLGASNATLRRPHAFTGFDQNDDIPLQALAEADWKTDCSGPYPIINCSLNLVGGRELAWQQRKAASFVFTPSFCGYDFSDLPPGYCPTTRNPKEKKSRAYAASRTPLTLATAMAISGAAASPNMGYHTSPAPAFLMTLFNVRLGWWIGNPRHKKGWSRSAPGWALGRLVMEMFGLTNAEGHYIYLSDGGHFENLGIFELVRRRCRFIIACDAEEDGDFAFEGLGNAIEKCRTDLGVEIELNVEAIRQRDESRHSHWHCAVGRIRYDLIDQDAHAGTLLYLKSSLTGDESTDVLRYAARNAAFPHESTMDQWFGESQFESYRALGHHVAMSAFHPVDKPENLAGLTTERLFVNLAQRWYPPSVALDPTFKRRGETLNALYETLRRDPDLHFLSQQIYSGWRNLVEGLEGAPEVTPPPGPWLPKKYEELRAGFYFCNRLILLMEDIYHDLHLEQEYDHPDNRGWMNLFMHWSWSRMFRTTWTVTAANCGARFQNFCVRHLGLEVGRIELTTVPDLPGLIAATTQPADLPLTYVEWQVVHAFFAEYKDLIQQSQLLLIQVMPGRSDKLEATAETKEPAFTAGFALLRNPRPDEEGRRLTYFRIRDHMRRMGMARRGLYKILKQDNKIVLDLRPMPETALRQDDEASRTSFQDLYRGVRTEFELHEKPQARGSDR